MQMKTKVILLLLLIVCTQAQAKLWMPSIFSDGMVLQADKMVPVWGEADPGTKVTVEFAGQKKTAITDSSNHWKIMLDPMPVSPTPQVLTVFSPVSSIKYQVSDVLVGEVWILAGQSNMGWPLKKCDGGDVAASRDYPWLFTFKQWPIQGACDEPARDVTGGQWLACGSNQVADLSGVGFFFARELHESLPPDTPIALINTQMGGTCAECWIDSRTLADTPSARPYLERARTEMQSGKKGEKGFLGKNQSCRPSALFNGKVAPLQPLAARGVIWYQGEGNSSQWLAPGYAETLTALIRSWRDGFEQPNLPFFVVQLPRYKSGRWNDRPMIRAAQAQVARALQGVELAVTIDLGQKEHIHPSDKEPVGERLALLARARVYGQNVACYGPLFQSLELKDGEAYVRFSNDDGLYLKGNSGFEICEADGVFVPACAEIIQGAIKLSNPDVTDPVGVRYGYFGWGEVCLFNKQDLPAAPFSTNIKDK
jgi:sialate O-acetylesterase